MYVYRADTFCDSCGERIRADLLAKGQGPDDPEDERSYDSDDFPKGPLAEEATDSPDHCARDRYCSGRIDLRDFGLEPDAPMFGAESRYIGALLSDGLTDEGVRYLAEMLAESDPTPYQRALHRFWEETFADELAEYRARDLEERARAMGADHGRAAASWFFDGNTPREHYAAVLQGLDDGDPAVLDTLPAAPLSGEWADSPTPASVLAELDVDEEDDRASDLLYAYEDAFYSASQSAIEETARKMLEDDPS